MTRQTMILTAAAAGSLALLMGAYVFQALGYAPCQLCLWQRWPHFAAVAIGLAIALGAPRGLAWAGALAALTTAGIGFYHSGVEQGWWEGLAACTANALAGVSAEDLLSTEVTIGAPVRCDEVAWSLFGLSMAGWNTLISLALAGLWTLGARTARA